MTQKYEIKNRWTSEVLFTCEIPDGMESGMIARHALETAIAEGANLQDANLQDANLRGANLWGADLRGADLRGAKNAPLIINGLSWMVVIDGVGSMRIGCQYHTVEAWKNFTDDEIKLMDSNALEFWNKYKSMLIAACETHVHQVEDAA